MNYEKKLSYRLIKFFYYIQIFLSVPISINVYYSTLNNAQNSTLLSVIYGIIAFVILQVFANFSTETILYITYWKKIPWNNIFKKSLILIKNNNKNASFLCEPMDIATYAIHEFFREKNGGSILLLWKPKNLILPKDIEESNTAFYATIGYMFYVYVLLVRNKFGEQISSIVKQYIVSLLNAPDRNREIEAGKKIASCLSAVEEIITRDLKDIAEVNTLIDDVHFEYRISMGFLSEFPDSPKFVPDEKRRGMTYGEIDDHNTQEYVAPIMECLFHGKKIVIDEFKKLIQSIQFKPHSIAELNMHEEIAWSKNPGCFEKHLKRKYNNPIFSPTDRKVTQKEVDLAREKDNRNSQEFYNQVKAWSNKNGHKNPDDFNINEDSDKADRLIMLGLKTGGKSLQLVSTIKEYQKQMTNGQKEILEKKENQEELNKFITLKRLQEKINTMLYDEFIQQVEMQDSPIKNDLAESILSEDVETIKIFVFMVIRHNRETRFRYELTKAVKEMLDRKESMALIDEKLELFGLKIFDGIVWSSNPGCFEAHLRRKFNNPIFHPSKRIITQQHVNLARERDLNDINELNIKAKSIIDTSKSNNLTVNQMNKLRQEIDDLAIKCYQVGGKALEVNQELQLIRKNIINILINFLTTKGEEAASALEGICNGEKIHHDSTRSFHNLFIQQAGMRKDSPILPEITESLLSEDAETISLYLNLAIEGSEGKAKLDDFKPDIIRVVNDMAVRNENTVEIKKKLTLVGISL